jgi:hypothetical protein
MALQIASTMMMTTMAWSIRPTHSHSMRVNPSTLTAMELATTQIKTMTATAQMMRRMVVHLMRTNPHQVNVGAALQTPTPIVTVLRIALTIALLFRIRLKMIATEMELVKRANHSQTAMQTAFQIRAILQADLRKIAMAMAGRIHAILLAAADRLMNSLLTAGLKGRSGVVAQGLALLRAVFRLRLGLEADHIHFLKISYAILMIRLVLEPMSTQRVVSILWSFKAVSAVDATTTDQLHRLLPQLLGRPIK